MAVNKATRLSKIAREFNVGISTIVEFLHKKGYTIDTNPNTKISPEIYSVLVQEYSNDLNVKKESEKVSLRKVRETKEVGNIETVEEESIDEEAEEPTDEVLIKDLSAGKPKEVPVPSQNKIKENIRVVGKIDIDSITGKRKPVKEEKIEEEKKVEEPKPEPKPEPKIEPKPEPKVDIESKQQSEKEQVEEKKKEEVKPLENQPPVKEEVKEEKVEELVETNEVETLEIQEKEEKEEVVPEEIKQEIFVRTEVEKISAPTVVGKIDLSSMNQRTRPPRKTKEQREEERKAKIEKQQAEEKEKRGREVQVRETRGFEGERQDSTNERRVERVNVKKPTGPVVVGKIDLPDKKKPVASSSEPIDKKKKRKRIKKQDKVPSDNNNTNNNNRQDRDSRDGRAGGGKTLVKKGQQQHDKRRGKHFNKAEISDEEIQKQVKDTLARLTSKGNKSKGSKYRREKRDAIRQELMEEEERKLQEKNIIKVTEFVSVNELANMMDVPPTDVIATCMNLGLFVSINQRLDAETMALIADEYNFKVEFVSVEIQESIGDDEEEDPANLEPRPPIVTVMGHVDHGKTKLLDHIRSANVIAGEAGGITQHIGAYSVQLDDGRNITFLDTPGHEAFTAMRARGAQITDVAIIVVAADDGVMPQTVEAINHASAAGVPMVFAINKIDKPSANPDKIKEELANMNYMVEDWGGKYQSQEISAKNGLNIEELLEKVLLEAELLELKANPNKRASGTIIESTLDKGRGFVATILVEEGSLRVGDILLAGHHTGHVKAMFNERGKRIDVAGPATPVVILGLNGAPQAGDKFNVMDSDKEAKEIASKREQLQREQGLRAQKHITLDEIGRRIAIGNFQELNVIVKGDVDGSIEALSDSLIKLSTEEIQVNIKHKAVGQISEADILLAAASDAIIIGFQVRPSVNARRLAEKEEIDIRLYSIIYDAINDVKAAMEGMLSPEIKEEITGTAEILETFKITKVGTIAGCIVKEGKVFRDSKVRIIRDGIVVYTGNLGSLKRFKDDAKEVVMGLECGLNIENFNDIKVGDIVESFKEIEVAKKLK